MTKRVVFCTYPGVYSEKVFAALQSSSEVDVVGVVLSTRTANMQDNLFTGAWRHIRRSGIHYALYQWAVTLGYESLGQLTGRPSLKARLEALAIPVLCTQDINQPEALAFINQVNPDILLSAHFNQLIKAALLSMPSLSCINIHPSLLPDFKGVDPGFFMMLENAGTMGASVHLISEGLDEGDILAQRTLCDVKNCSLMSLNLALFQQGIEAAIEVITSDTWTPQPQVMRGRYDSWPSKKQVKSFRQRYPLLKFRQWLSLATKQLQ